MFPTRYKTGRVRFAGLKAAGWKRARTAPSESLASPRPVSSATWGGGITRGGGRVSLRRPRSDPGRDTRLSPGQPDSDRQRVLLRDVGGEGQDGKGAGALEPPNCGEGLADP